MNDFENKSEYDFIKNRLQVLYDKYKNDNILLAEIHQEISNIRRLDPLCAENSLFMFIHDCRFYGAKQSYENLEAWWTFTRRDFFTGTNDTTFQIYKRLATGRFSTNVDRGENEVKESPIDLECPLHYYFLDQKEILSVVAKEFYLCLQRKYLDEFKLLINTAPANGDIWKSGYDLPDRHFDVQVKMSFDEMATAIKLFEIYVKDFQNKQKFILELSEWFGAYEVSNQYWTQKDCEDCEKVYNDTLWEFLKENAIKNESNNCENPVLDRQFVVWHKKFILVSGRKQSFVDKIREKISAIFTQKKELSITHKLSNSNNGSFINLLKTSSVLKNNQSIANELDKMYNNINSLYQLYAEKEAADIFIKVRCEQYVKPYLEYAEINNGILNKDDQKRFLSLFEKVNAILCKKRQEFFNQQNIVKKIEFDVIEEEVDKYLREM